jgi:hypothetical protein
VPFQVASRLPMSKTIVPLVDPTAYVATGVLDNRRGALILFSAAQRLSEVQVVTGAAGGGLVRTAGVIGRIDRGAGSFLTRLVSDQFNEDVSLDMIGGDEMISSGGVDVVAHPAKKNAATNRIASDLDTRSLCGWGNRTQAVSTCCQRPAGRSHSYFLENRIFRQDAESTLGCGLSATFDSFIICQRQTHLLENTRCHHRSQRRALRATPAR